MKWGSCCFRFFFNVASHLTVPTFNCISEFPGIYLRSIETNIIQGVLDTVFWKKSQVFLMQLTKHFCLWTTGNTDKLLILPKFCFSFSTFSALSFTPGSVLPRTPNVRMKSIWYVINTLVWFSLMCHFFRNANGGVWDSMIAWVWGLLRKEKLCFLAPKMTLLRE